MKEFNFSIFSSDELYTLSDRTVQCMNDSGLEDPFNDKVTECLVSNNADLSKAIGRNLKSELTPEILSADEKRDKCFVGMRDYVYAFRNSTNQSKAEAANRLSAKIENQGWTLYRLSLPKQTASMNALFAELDKPESQADIATLAATDWYADAKNSQTNFESVYQTKVNKESEVNIPLMKESTRYIRFFLKGLYSYIEVNTELTPATYKVISDKLDKIITDVSTIARARQTRKINQKAGNGSSGTTDGSTESGTTDGSTTTN